MLIVRSNRARAGLWGVRSRVGADLTASTCGSALGASSAGCVRCGRYIVDHSAISSRHWHGASTVQGRRWRPWFDGWLCSTAEL